MAQKPKASVNKLLIKRIAVIDREIGEKRFPNKDRLASRLSVSTKTIQRDLDFMKYEYDAPIGFDKQRKGFYYTNPDFRLNPLQINASDFLAVAVTEKVLEQYKNTPYSGYFKNFYEKISNLFDGKLSVDVRDLDRIMSFYIGPVRQVDKSIMDKVENALRECIRVNVRYLTGYSGTESERFIDIYHLKNYQGDWYIIGYCHKAQQIKVFAVSRIKEITLTNRHYEIPDKFSIDEYFADSFGIFEGGKIHQVKLKIMNESARYVTERKWHKSQKITPQKDGSIVVEYRVNNLTDMFFWILSLGRNCEVLLPKEFREEVIDELKHMAANYWKR